MNAKRLLSSQDFQHVPDGCEVRTCGIVTLRQQPDTAKGTIFVSLEDEHGAMQVIVWRHVRNAQCQVLFQFRLLTVRGGTAARRYGVQPHREQVGGPRVVDRTPRHHKSGLPMNAMQASLFDTDPVEVCILGLVYQREFRIC